MRSFKNLNEIKSFCKENNISFAQTDRKSDLLEKIQIWENICLEKIREEQKKASELSAYEFGQIYKLSKVNIAYLKKCFGDKRDSYNNWVQVCKDKKVIDK